MSVILNDPFKQESFRDRCFGASQWCRDAASPFVSLCFQLETLLARDACVCLHVELSKKLES